MKAKDVMTRQVRTVGPDQSAQQAAALMIDEDTGAIPVIEDGRVVGMITDRDIAVRAIARGHGPETPVSDLMTSGTICARLDDSLEEVAARMSEAHVRRLPVIDENGLLCGIVSLGDLARETSDESAEQALDGVSAPGNEHNQG